MRKIIGKTNDHTAGKRRNLNLLIRIKDELSAVILLPIAMKIKNEGKDAGGIGLKTVDVLLIKGPWRVIGQMALIFPGTKKDFPVQLRAEILKR